MYFWFTESISGKVKPKIFHSDQFLGGKLTAAKWKYRLICKSLGKATTIPKSLIGVSVQFRSWSVMNTIQAWLQKRMSLGFPKVTAELPKYLPSKVSLIMLRHRHGTPWYAKFSPMRTGIVSGWRQVRGNTKKKSCRPGFVLRSCRLGRVLVAAIRPRSWEIYLTSNGKYCFQFGKVFFKRTRDDAVNWRHFWEGRKVLMNASFRYIL